MPSGPALRRELTGGPELGEPSLPQVLDLTGQHDPHASRRLTAAARQTILLDDDELTAELDRMTDAHTDVIASVAASSTGLRPWLFTNQYSRLVVDPERFLDEREEMRAVGMGTVYTHTSDGGQLRTDDPAHIEDLLATHYLDRSRSCRHRP